MVAITVASVSCRVDTGSVEANFATLERWARRAASARATLALFPEGFLSGYPLAASSRASVAERAIRLPGPVTDRLAALSSELGLFICTGLLERGDDGNLYISQAMIDPQRGYAGAYRKVHASDGLGEEAGNDWPLWDVNGVCTGVMICRDKSFPESARILALGGAALLLNPHSTPSGERIRVPGKHEHTPFMRRCVLTNCMRSVENGCFTVLNNNIWSEQELRAATSASAPEPLLNEGWNLATDPSGTVIGCDCDTTDPNSAGREKMLCVTIDPLLLPGPNVLDNLWTRTPQ
eukprot:COSAG05_NODE_3917_length_1774_cov_8.412537_1_plen_292_part_10